MSEDKTAKAEATPPKDKKEAKANLETAKTNLQTFMTENKLKEDSEPTDEKVAKKLKRLRIGVKDAKAALKALKGGASGRATQYEYPAGMTDAKEKKKFRTQQRAAKKKAEKGDAPAKEKKADKAAPAAEAPAKKKKVKKSED
jgi:hypothetical protein